MAHRHERMNGFLDMAERLWQRESMDERMNSLAGYYHSGTEFGEGAEFSTSVNKVFPRVRIAMANLFAKRPEIIARPTRGEFQKNARTASGLLNYLVRKKKHGQELRDYLRNARLFHYGAMLLGMEGSGSKGDPKLPFIRSLDPRSVRVDPTLERFSPDENKWVFRKFRKTMMGLKMAGIYEDAKLKKATDFLFNRSGEKFEEDTTMLWIGEHYLKEEDGKILTASAILGAASDTDPNTQEFTDEIPLTPEDRQWIREDRFTNAIGLPMRFLVFVPSPHTYYPQSPIELWLPQQREFNVFRSQKLTEAHRGARKIIVNMDGIDEEELVKLESLEPLEVIKVSGSITDKVGPIELGDIPSETFSGEIDTERSIAEIDGAGSAQTGTEPKRGSTSATEQSIVDQNFKLRSSDTQEIWNEAMTDLYSDQFTLAQLHMKGEVWVQIVGESAAGVEIEAQANRENIIGEFDVEPLAGSMMPIDRSTEVAKGQALIELALKAQGLINPQAAIRTGLEKMDYRNIDELLAPPQPVAQPQGGGGGMGAQPQSTGIAQMVQQATAQQQAGPGSTPQDNPNFGGNQ